MLHLLAAAMATNPWWHSRCSYCLKFLRTKSLPIPEEWKREWFLSFYELEEEWIVGGFSGVGVDG